MILSNLELLTVLNRNLVFISIYFTTWLRVFVLVKTRIFSKIQSLQIAQY